MSGYVVVFGGCSWDNTFKQKEDLSYPEFADIGLPGGKGSNQAVAIARAGYKVKMISIIGNDKSGKDILKNLQDNNIDTSCVKVSKEAKSDSASLYVSITGDNNIIRSRESIDEFDIDLIKENEEVIKNADFVVTQTKVPRKVIEALIDFCFKNNVKTVLTPCPAKGYEFCENSNKELLEKITYITANADETKLIMGEEDVEKSIDRLPNLISTAGSKGVYFCDEEGFFVNVPAVEPRELKDTTGAGDTFCGNFIVGILNGLNKKEAVKRGVWAATLKLEHLGAQPGIPTKKELEERTKF